VEPQSTACAASGVEQTGLFRLITIALEAIGEGREPYCAWIHARGMSAPWDAPREFRERFADLSDPSPPDFVELPEYRLAVGSDPDRVLGAVQAYGAQVQVLDECLGLLLDAIDQRDGRENVLLALTSPRGYPLGEHGRVGPCDNALYSELLQVPLLVRLPGGEARLQRFQGLVQSCDLPPLIAESCGWSGAAPGWIRASLLDEIRGAPASAIRTIACASGPGQRAIRTPAWLLRESADPNATRRELFAKPDDRWDSNEVSSRCGDIAELLAAELQRFEAAATGGRLADLAPPPEILSDSWH
jgi:arylsulfatase A-like enzyme